MANLLDYALTTLADVKESLGIASSVTTYDNLIKRKINQATLAIENYCGRRFKLTTYTDEGYSGTNIDQVILKNRPIVGSVAFSIRDNTLNEDDFETIETSLVFADNNSGILNLNFRAIGHWSRYKATYQAGYSTIPEDLAEACATLAAYYYTNASGTQLGLAQKKEGQRETRFSNNNHLLTFDNILAQLGIDGIINSYANNPVMTDR